MDEQLSFGDDSFVNVIFFERSSEPVAFSFVNKIPKIDCKQIVLSVL